MRKALQDKRQNGWPHFVQTDSLSCHIHFEENDTRRGNNTSKQEINWDWYFVIRNISTAFYRELVSSFCMTAREYILQLTNAPWALTGFMTVKSFIGKLENLSRLNWYKMTNFLFYFKNNRKFEMDLSPYEHFSSFYCLFGDVNAFGLLPAALASPPKWIFGGSSAHSWRQKADYISIKDQSQVSLLTSLPKAVRFLICPVQCEEPPFFIENREHKNLRL